MAPAPNGGIKSDLDPAPTRFAENAKVSNVTRESWALVFPLAQRSVPVTRLLYLTKAAAFRDAEKIRKLVAVERVDTVTDSIAHLAQSGRKMEAVTQASRMRHMTTTEAKDLVEQQQKTQK